ncbi:hypothetical protein BCR37DRAFT_122720 [Protomyces lactucae-debilis]|uniref:RanBP2-type domain-containing protein n=1 Tax=Protomyces lactucae-debilis TaxID=2754530 RepID=A0A1Y2F1T7_PROLT|nr:uncharacterized protein BCR37DRAFT_122720 [Protomyces lactucae-debilis]ORY77803.1 hypothetical protein BCR37DRAFT_122720 [Protomyces lactucae-debilis]
MPKDSRQGSAFTHPQTPRNPQRPSSSGGSILKSIFSPAVSFFGRHSTQSKKQARIEQAASKAQTYQEDEEAGGTDNDDEYDDEEGRVGLQEHIPPPPQRQGQASTTARPTTPATAPFPFSFTPVRAQNASGTPSPYAAPPSSASPQAVLAEFFKNRGDAPFTEVEREGILALVSRAGSPATAMQPPSPVNVTPARPAYTPIFTPAAIQTTTGTAPGFHPGTSNSVVRQGSLLASANRKRPPSFTSALAQSPFKRRSSLARTSFAPQQPDSPQRRPQESMEMAALPPTEASGAGKRGLEDVAAPLAKRTKMSHVEDSQTGRATAASMLAILEDGKGDLPASEETVSEEQKQKQIQAMLNPYARSSVAPSPRRVRQSPARAERGLSVLAVMRGTPAKEKQSLTYTPDGALVPQKKGLLPLSSGSLFPPRGGQTLQAESSFSQTPKTKTHSQSSAFSLTASQSSLAPGNASATFKQSFATTDVDEGQNDTRSVPSRESQQSANTPGKRRGFGLHSDDEEMSGAVDSGAQEHAAHGGFEAVRSTDTAKAAPAFSSGDKKSDTAEHQSHGGFVFNPPTKSTSEEPVDSPANVHKLRDGTEYISPSKKHTEQETSAPSGFVFKPSAAKTTSAFSFGQSQSSDTTPAPAKMSFTFDPTKKAEPLAKPLVAPKPATVQAIKDDDRTRAARVPASQLEAFIFSLDAPTTPGKQELKERAGRAELIAYHFTTTTQQTTTAPPKPQTGGFNWAAAGMKAPVASGWTCDVCMVSNSTDKTTCVSCESSKPAGTSATAPAPPVKSSGGFNWAAAGMTAPKTAGWSCDVCMVSNPADASKCLACESPKP